MLFIQTVLRRAYIKKISRNVGRYSKVDPGISHRTKMFDDMEKDFDEDDDLDDLETDFMHVGKSFKEHQREQALKHERLKYLIVRQKYFKQKFPNFLTWHDKEQIKNLNRTDPEEWTVEKLSESFPAPPSVIIKIIKTKYEKKHSGIVSHDKTVATNWQLFKSGKMLDLPEDLVEHLNKFTDRSLILQQNNNDSCNKSEVVNVFNTHIGKGEFADIITSYQKLKKMENKENRVDVNIDVKKQLHEDNKETYLAGAIKNKEMVTLSKLQKNLEIKMIGGSEVSESDLLLLKSHQKSTQEKERVDLNHIDVTDILENKYQETTTAVLTETKRDCSYLIYPQRIVIPKNIRKRGYTYKLNDCYYDDDGEFLYRVPGMG